MDMAAVGQAIILLYSLALVFAIIGLVLHHLISAWLIEQSMHGWEAAVWVVLLVVVSLFTFAAWATPRMAIPPTIGMLLWFTWAWYVRRHDQGAEASHQSAEEVRAWAMIERDPSNLAAYERLAMILEAQRRWETLLAVLEQWHDKRPDEPGLTRRIERLRAQLAPPPQS